MSDWFYAQDDQKTGPLPAQEIRILLEQGIISADTLVWTNGMADWLPASAVPTFSDSIVETATCAVTGKIMRVDEMLNYGDKLIDPAQKDLFVQQLREGVTGGEGVSTIDGYTYADPTLRANYTKWFFIIGTFLEIGITVLDFFDSNVDSEVFTASDGFIILFGLGYLPVWIAGIVFFCMWKHCVCSNAYALGGMKKSLKPITPGWAVGYYFIPIVSLWKPYQAMKEIWLASVDGKRPSAILGTWWTLWIFSGIIGNISFRLTLAEGDENLLLILDSITSVMAIPLLFTILRIIREITEAQKKANSGD